ncbi:MAG: GTP-binding protein HSR1 [Hyphomicrobium sp.]
MSDALTPLRVAFVSLGLLLPTLILIPLGSLWLWQNGYLLHWAFAALVTTGAAYVFQRWTLTAAGNGAAIPPPAIAADASDANDAEMQDLRRRAEAVVESIADQTGSLAIASWNDLLNCGLETVEAVSMIYHPDRKDPMLRFTVPEALNLVEKVSHRLRPIFEGAIPLGSRLTVAQFAQLYRWRSVYDAAGRAWSVWRVLRLANPATAATNELRERLGNSLFGWAKESIAGRMGRTYIREVGQAAIDLYSGQLASRPQSAPSIAAEDGQG